MFQGRYEHAIDGKGRTSVPSRFREVLAGLGETKLVLTTGFDRCIAAYPLATWSNFLGEVAKLSRFDPAVIQLRRTFISSAQEMEFDKLGRILIPGTLRKHGDFQRDVLWAGMGDSLELWDKERHEAMCNGVYEDPDKREVMMRRLAELGL